ncbi:MAG: histone H1 [Candidatus Acidiferrales bacterium]
MRRERLAWHRINMPARDKQKKRPKDVNQLAHFLGDLSTREPTETGPVFSSSLSAYMSTIGRKGGEIGGKRRMKTMTPAQRSKIAKKAASVRWAKIKRKSS